MMRALTPNSDPVSRSELLQLFVAVFLPMFMAAVDQTLLATATPAIAEVRGDRRRRGGEQRLVHCRHEHRQEHGDEQLQQLAAGNWIGIRSQRPHHSAALASPAGLA